MREYLAILIGKETSWVSVFELDGSREEDS